VQRSVALLTHVAHYGSWVMFSESIWQNQAHFANLHTTAILNQIGRLKK
jgi:hypothetical protein